MFQQKTNNRCTVRWSCTSAWISFIIFPGYNYGSSETFSSATWDPLLVNPVLDCDTFLVSFGTEDRAILTNSIGCKILIFHLRYGYCKEMNKSKLSDVKMVLYFFFTFLIPSMFRGKSTTFKSRLRNGGGKGQNRSGVPRVTLHFSVTCTLQHRKHFGRVEI